MIVQLHARRLQVVSVEHRPAPGGDQELIGSDRVEPGDVDTPAVAGLQRALDRHARVQGDAVLLERGDERRGGVVVLERKDVRQGLEDRHRRAEPCVDLCELDADRAGTDHHERRRRDGRLPDRLLVRPEVSVLQPVDRWNRRLGAGGEHDAIRLDLRAVGELDAVRTDEPRLLEEDADPRTFERGGALTGSRLDHVASALLDGGEVDRHRRDPHAEPTGLASERRDLRAPQHDLGRDAAVVVALAAELVALRDGDTQTRSCPAGTPPRSRFRHRRSRRRRNAPPMSSTPSGRRGTR